MTFKSMLIGATLATSLFSAHAGDPIDIQNGWVRATVAGQSATGAFMTLTAKQDAKLVAVSSPVAGVAEVHEMKMDGDVMRMRAVQGGLSLPAGQAVALKPGGYHVMLMDLKAPVAKDSTVAVTLTFSDAKGEKSQVQLELPVKAMAPAGMAAGKEAPMMSHGMHGATPAK